MSLLGFGYLRRRWVVMLILVLSLASFLFSVTAYCFLGFYNGLVGYVGEEADVVAVYSRVGSTPFTGAIPLDLSSQISSFSGVVEVSPEVVAPATVSGQSVFFRGVVPSAIDELNGMNMLNGTPLALNDTDCVIVGEDLADRMRLEVGESILAFGVLSGRYVELHVKGIFQSDSPLNDEAVVPLYVGQWLRGLSYNHVSFIRVKIDPSQIGVNQIYSELSNSNLPSASTTPASPEPTPKSRVQRELDALLPLSRANITIGDIGVKDSAQFMQTYLNRYGVSKDTLLVLSVVVLAFGSGTAVGAAGLFVKQHNSEICTLQALGASKRKLKIDLIIRFLIFTLIATLMGTVFGVLAITVFGKLGFLQVLSHTIVFSLDPLVVVANFCLLSLLMGVYVVRMEVEP